jgi:ASC-1-like (ASCH) protein
MKWKDSLIKELINELKDDINWSKIVAELEEKRNIGVHLAIFNEPFLSLIYEGKKKIESRFSINKVGPYHKIYEGDLVVLKESGGSVTGLFLAGEVRYFSNLDINALKNIEINYGDLICSHHSLDFWVMREKSNYATLINITNVQKIPPIKVSKKDRAGWSVILQKNSKELFEQNYAE